ncbi:MAG: SPOR domain-containing protein [Pseudomonadota bacterium]
MIWFLRNASVHIWITTLVALPTCFYILPALIRFFPQIDPMVIGFMMIVIVASVISLVMDIIAKKVLDGLIKEGLAWERAGIINKAEKRYIRAVRLFDSFLLWPLGASKMAQKIAGVVARFQLNTKVENENFKAATCAYLKMNPADKDISRLWLKRLRLSSVVTSVEQEVLSLLAETHDADVRLSPLIADIFLGLERRDFAAQKLYGQMQKEPELSGIYAKKIETLIGLPEDESLGDQVFFDAPKKKFKTSVSIKSKPLLKNLWDRMKININLGKKIKLSITALWSSVKWSYQFIGSAISFLLLSMVKTIGYVKDHERARFYLKTSMLTLVAAWLLFFMVSTAFHLFKPKTIEKEKQTIVEQIPKPYTIQVAAYLKREYADRYADALKKKGIQASVKMVGGGGKDWFVVRVSEFESKKSAAAYGLKLKQQKIIDDYFVNNK